MYFNMMPQLLINLYNQDLQYKQVTDITTRAISSAELRSNIFLYDTYDVKDWETPEILADKFYNDPQLHWVILLCNDIIDPAFDWVIPSDVLLQKAIQQYGEENINKTHHWVDEFGNWVNSTHPNSAAITNIEYEEELNEKKRQIKILKTDYLNSFVDEVETKLKAQIL